MSKGLFIGVVVAVVLIGVVAFSFTGGDNPSTNEAESGEKNLPGGSEQAGQASEDGSDDSTGSTDSGSSESMEDSTDSGSSGSVGTHTIEMTSSEFSPSDLEISLGDTVVFVNKGTSRHWPATDIHPTHKVYPGSDISKCGTPEEDEIFDSCRGLMLGEEYSFTFNEAGEWEYHDHLKPSLGGTITVS